MHDADEQYEQFERDESAPVDMLAALFEARGWSFELDGEDEITAEYKGSWASYQLRAIWREEDNALQLIILPDITVPADKRAHIYTALGLINEQLWLGHFDMWSANGILLFRHGSLMASNGLLGVDQAQTIIDVAIDECERFYPVFQFIIWGDKTPEEAIASAFCFNQIIHIAHRDGLIPIFLPCPRLNIGHRPAKTRDFAYGIGHLIHAPAHEINGDIDLLDGRIAALGT
jgi:hypothetical protein